MGVKLTSDILKEGMELAGVQYRSTDPRPLKWLKDWLRSVALGFPWPECDGFVAVNLPVNGYLIEMGRSATYVNGKYIHRITFPLKQVFDSCVPNSINQETFDKALIAYPNNIPQGFPTEASYTRDWEEPGRIAIVFNRRPKEVLEIQINYQWDPAAALLVTDYPWYANDQTMIQAVAYWTSYYHDGPATPKTKKLEEDLAIMVMRDKVKFGIINPPFTGIQRSFAGK